MINYDLKMKAIATLTAFIFILSPVVGVHADAPPAMVATPSTAEAPTVTVAQAQPNLAAVPAPSAQPTTTQFLGGDGPLSPPAPTNAPMPDKQGYSKTTSPDGTIVETSYDPVTGTHISTKVTYPNGKIVETIPVVQPVTESQNTSISADGTIVVIIKDPSTGKKLYSNSTSRDGTIVEEVYDPVTGNAYSYKKTSPDGTIFEAISDPVDGTLRKTKTTNPNGTYQLIIYKPDTLVASGDVLAALAITLNCNPATGECEGVDNTGVPIKGKLNVDAYDASGYFKTCGLMYAPVTQGAPWDCVDPYVKKVPPLSPEAPASTPDPANAPGNM